MPLTFNLRHVEKKPLHLEGLLTPEELEINNIDELIDLPEPVEYDLNLERLSQSVLVRGRLSTTLACECVRCLRPFNLKLELQDWTCDLPLTGDEKVPANNDCVDLTPYVREDILLAFPQHPLCEAGCRGLRDLEQNANEPASVDKQASAASSAWAELNKLKF